MSIRKLEFSGRVWLFKVRAFALMSKIFFPRFSEKSPGKLHPLRCTLLSFGVTMLMLLFQNNLILVVIIGLNCLMVIIRSWYYSGQVLVWICVVPLFHELFNPIKPDLHLKFKHTLTHLQFLPTGLFKYAWHLNFRSSRVKGQFSHNFITLLFLLMYILAFLSRKLKCIFCKV